MQGEQGVALASLLSKKYLDVGKSDHRVVGKCCHSPKESHRLAAGTSFLLELQR